MIQVNSSNIEQVAYDPTTATLLVHFHGGGQYSYAGVPQDVFDALLNSESKGKYFNKYIKTSYSHTKLN